MYKGDLVFENVPVQMLGTMKWKINRIQCFERIMRMPSSTSELQNGSKSPIILRATNHLSCGSVLAVFQAGIKRKTEFECQKG